MKQRISVEQLAELSDDQKNRLREWWKPENGDHVLTWYVYNGQPRDVSESIIGVNPLLGRTEYFDLESCSNDGERDYYGIENMLPLLSNGQMIGIISEFATSKGSTWEIKHDWYNYKVQVHSVKETAREPLLFACEETLCDSLWEMVKMALAENPQ